MKNNTILFVEDEATIREELSQFLERYTDRGLYIGENGEEGLALYEKYHPDIVISDIKMPKMTGIEMIKRIKASNPDQAIILTTAHSDSSFFLEAIELQVDGYLLKPLDLKLLDKKIKKISEHIVFRREYETQKIIMNEIAHLQGSMLAVLNEEFKLLFLNDKALAFWGEENIEEAIKHDRMLSSRMVKQEEYFYPSEIEGRHWITEIQLLPPHKRIIALWTPGKEVINTYVVDVTYSAESKHTIISLSEITKMEEEKKLYQKQIYVDELTQIYNRTMFNKQLDIELKRANSEKSELSMIVMDIDHFKQVNDHYGHMVGDEVLVGLTHLIKRKIRANDLFARWGGEEFVILLPDTDSEGARILAENLRKMIEVHTFSADISLTCSFGVAAKKQDDVYLFRKADEALYRAKLNGRNRVVIY